MHFIIQIDIILMIHDSFKPLMKNPFPKFSLVRIKH